MFSGQGRGREDGLTFQKCVFYKDHPNFVVEDNRVYKRSGGQVSCLRTLDESWLHHGKKMDLLIDRPMPKHWYKKVPSLR